MNLLRTLLPQWAYARLIGTWDRDGLRKYAANTWWMFIGRFAMYPISLVVIASVARYLGPDGLGTLSYAQSIIGIIATVTALGIDQILVRDLIRSPEKANELLGTAFYIQLVTTSIAFITTVCLFFVFETDLEKVWIIVLMASAMVTGPFSMGVNLFTAQALSKYPTIITLATRITIAALKLLCVALALPLISFAALFLVESVLTLVLSLYFCRRMLGNVMSSWVFSVATLKRLLSDSWPLLISAAAVYLFARIDQVMLQHYIGAEEVGLYGATVQFTDTWTFMPTLIIGSLYPAVAGMYHANRPEYARRMRMLTGLALSIACGIGIVVIAFAPFIVHIIYGNAFAGAVPILQMYTLYVPIAILYAIVQNHLVTANRTRMMIVIGVVGALVNIGLNTILIPSMGAIGATIATIVAGSIMIIIPFAIHRRTAARAHG